MDHETLFRAHRHAALTGKLANLKGDADDFGAFVLSSSIYIKVGTKAAGHRARA